MSKNKDNLLTPTHQTTTSDNQDVVAWQNKEGNYVPMWVFRNFHDLGGRGVLSHRNGAKVNRGDWIVRLADPTQQVALVFTDAEFRSCFREIPPVKDPNAQGK